MTTGDLYYIDQKGNQEKTISNISLQDAKKKVKEVRSIADHVNFMSCQQVCYEGTWMFLRPGGGWWTLSKNMDDKKCAKRT